MPCYAPVFSPTHWFWCPFRNMLIALTIASLIIATFGFILASEKGRCTIARLRYQIRHCREGNSDPRRIIYQ